jgi:hypothetical protein
MRGASDRVQMQESGPEAQGATDKLLDVLADEVGVDMRQELDSREVPNNEVGESSERHKNPQEEDFLKKRLRDLRAE